MWVDALLVVLALAVLTFGAELLVRGAAALARRLAVSPFFIGLTIVGFGTSTPELFTSLVATARGQVDISVGNVVGSNIFNVAFILGVAALVAPIGVRLSEVRSEAWTVLVVAAAPFLALLWGGTLGRPVGALLLAGIALYVWRGYRRGRAAGAAEAEVEIPGAPAEAGSAGRSLLRVAAGLAALVAGSALLVDSAADLARDLGVSELVIGLTVVAAGTSAPELFTSLVAALRKESAIAVGNVLGSNVFNIAGILGLAALLSPQALAPQVLRLDAPVMLGASALLIVALETGSRISRAEGAALLALYLAYLGMLLGWAPGVFPS